jgi:hypothetical protein
MAPEERAFPGSERDQSMGSEDKKLVSPGERE